VRTVHPHTGKDPDKSVPTPLSTLRAAGAKRPPAQDIGHRLVPNTGLSASHGRRVEPSRSHRNRGRRLGAPGDRIHDPRKGACTFGIGGGPSSSRRCGSTETGAPKHSVLKRQLSRPGQWLPLARGDGGPAPRLRFGTRQLRMRVGRTRRGDRGLWMPLARFQVEGHGFSHRLGAADTAIQTAINAWRQSIERIHLPWVLPIVGDPMKCQQAGSRAARHTR
jgi:hypothetical protein